MMRRLMMRALRKPKRKGRRRRVMVRIASESRLNDAQRRVKMKMKMKRLLRPQMIGPQLDFRRCQARKVRGMGWFECFFHACAAV